MKIITVVFSALLLSGVAVAQKAPDTKPETPPVSTTLPGTVPSSTKPVPQLTEEEKTQILFLQRNIAESVVSISNLKESQANYQKQLETLAASVQKRLGPTFTINRDTLVVTEVVPTPTPADTKK